MKPDDFYIEGLPDGDKWPDIAASHATNAIKRFADSVERDLREMGFTEEDAKSGRYHLDTSRRNPLTLKGPIIVIEISQ